MYDIVNTDLATTYLWYSDVNLETTFFEIFILHNSVSILGTLLLQNFVRKLIKLILESFDH